MARQKTKEKRALATPEEPAEVLPSDDPRDAWLFDLARKDPDIWRMLSEPVGTPFELTAEQADAIMRAGIGARPDLPPGKEYVKRMKKHWRFRDPRA